MAMVSMMFVLLLIVLGLLGAIAAVGLVLLAVGVVNRRKPRYAGKRSPTVCMVLGGILLALSLLPGAVLSVKMIGTLITTATTIAGQTMYECVPDRWRNDRWVTDEQAADEAIDALLTSADSGDRDAFAKNFTPALQERDDFDAAVDAFLAAYPKGLSQCERSSDGPGGTGSYDAGHVVKESSITYRCMLDGEWYYLTLDYCYQNTDNSEQVGVYAFTVMDLPARAVYMEHVFDEEGYGEDIWLLCDRLSSQGVTARMIDRYPLLWTSTDAPKLTADEWRALCANCHRMDDSAFKDAVGSPNAAIDRLYEYYYEMASEDGEPRCACVVADSPYGEIFGVYPCTTDTIFYDAPIWESEKEK